MSVESTILVRRAAFIIIGISCLSLAVAILVGFAQWREYSFWPGYVGIAGALAMVVAGFAAGENAKRVWDELYDAEWSKAIQTGYWLALFIFPLFGFIRYMGWLQTAESYALHGLFTGGLPLLYYVYLDMKE